MINWELTFPGRVYTPAVSLPSNVTGRWSPSALQPCLAISSSKTPIGRSGSLPLPSKRQCFPNAPAIGSKKRRVEPLSPQSRVQSCPSACPFACPILSTGQRSISAPRLCRQRAVASISSDQPSTNSTLSSSANAAAISERCPSDFEEMIRTCPCFNGVFSIFIFISYRLYANAVLTKSNTSSVGIFTISQCPIFVGRTKLISPPLRFLSFNTPAAISSAV